MIFDKALDRVRREEIATLDKDIEKAEKQLKDMKAKDTSKYSKDALKMYQQLLEKQKATIQRFKDLRDKHIAKELNKK